MDLYFLNFQRVLVVLTTKEMRSKILELIDGQEIDVGIKFVDSYIQAANLILEQKNDPFDHIILNLSLSNKKLKDFLEFIQPTVDKKDNFIIEYNQNAHEQEHVLALPHDL